MTNLEIIHKLQESIFTDEDDNHYSLEFQPALTEQELEMLTQRFPNNNIDAELLEILRETKGWEGGGLEQVSFDSIGEFGYSELSSYSITLGHDGFGNCWILDIDQEGKLGKVFYACHDPAVLVIHSQHLNEFLHHLLEFYNQPEACYLNKVHDQTVMKIWKHNSLCHQKTEFVKENPEYKDFLAQFEGEEWTVADLRKGNNEDGFAWGKSGPNQLTQRHERDLIWVIKNKKKGVLSKWFGR